jgi:hypothetical protein
VLNSARRSVRVAIQLSFTVHRHTPSSQRVIEMRSMVRSQGLTEINRMLTIRATWWRQRETGAL